MCGFQPGTVPMGRSVRCTDHYPKQKPAAVSRSGFCFIDHRDEKISVLGRPGSDLLFQALRLSTIGAEGFNGRVRYGNGFRPLARTTRPAKNRLLQTGFLDISGSILPDVILTGRPGKWAWEMRTIKIERA